MEAENTWKIKKEEDRKAEQVQLEDAKQEVALYIVQHYEGVEKIQFGDMVKIDTAGSWDVTAKVNQSNSMGISFDSLDTIASSIVCRTNPKTFKLIEKNDTSKSLEHILVKYGDGFK